MIDALAERSGPRESRVPVEEVEEDVQTVGADGVPEFAPDHERTGVFHGDRRIGEADLLRDVTVHPGIAVTVLFATCPVGRVEHGAPGIVHAGTADGPAHGVFDPFPVGLILQPFLPDVTAAPPRGSGPGEVDLFAFEIAAPDEIFPRPGSFGGALENAQIHRHAPRIEGGEGHPRRQQRGEKERKKL